MDKDFDYIEFVEQQLTRLRQMTKLQDGSGQITPGRLNYCISNYQEVAWGLISEYQRLKKDYEVEERKFNMWWSKIFMISSDQLNADRAKSKYASRAEIEANAKITNEKDYMEKAEILNDLKEQVDFVMELIKQWKAYKDLIINLSYNTRAELKALHVEDWANNEAVKAEDDKKKRRIKKNDSKDI